MKTRTFAKGLLFSGMLLLGIVALSNSIVAPSVSAQNDDPSAVAQAFYSDYLDYLLNTGNPTTDRIYHDSALVTQNLVQTMDANLDEGVFADPFLCAQNFPDAVSVFDSQVTGDTAIVIMTTNFQGHFITVDMLNESGAWKLDAIGCGDRLNSVRVVESFYNWYIAEVLDGNNPISTESFRTREELSPNLVASMDQQIAEGVFADPFVCAQNFVERIELVEVLAWSGETRILIGSNFENHYITASVVFNRGVWQLDSVECGDHLSPRAVTDDFYGWYIDYTQTQGNPLSDRAYQDRDELSWGLIQTTNRILEEGLSFDPFLCAQDYPDSFSTSLISRNRDDAVVQVTTSFEDYQFTVSLIQSGTKWLIDEVNCPVP